MKECETEEAAKIFERMPSIRDMYHLTLHRKNLLQSCLPRTRNKQELEALGGKPGVHPVMIPTKAAVIECIKACGMPTQKVFSSIDNLMGWDELFEAESALGSEATETVNTEDKLEAAKKKLNQNQDALKSLVETLKSQATRLSQSRNQAFKQFQQEKVEGVQPVAQPKKGAKTAKTDGFLGDIPSEYEEKIVTVDYKDAAFSSKITALMGKGVPIILTNAPHPHKLQQSELRLQILVHRASITTKDEKFVAEGHSAVPLGGSKASKGKLRTEMIESVLGKKMALELVKSAPGDSEEAQKASVVDYEDFFLSATKEETNATTTETFQMGAVHCLMSGQVRIILVDFMKMSKFANIANVKIGSADEPRPSASDNSDAEPGLHPNKVIEFVKGNLGHNANKEILRESGAYGVKFHTGTICANNMLIVPPGYIKITRPVKDKSTAMMLSTPYLSRFCVCRQTAFDFVKDSVRIFQKPPDTHPMWRLMTLISATLKASPPCPTQPPEVPERECPETPQKQSGPGDLIETPPKEPKSNVDKEEADPDTVRLKEKVEEYVKKASSQSGSEAIASLRGMVACFPKTVDTCSISEEANSHTKNGVLGLQSRRCVVSQMQNDYLVVLVIKLFRFPAGDR